MIIFDVELENIEKAEQASGKLASSKEDDKLMKSVLKNDKKKVEEGKLVQEAFNRNIASFTPDLMFENIVNNFQIAKKIYGPSIIRMLSGYDPKYIDRNAHIPEFKQELKKQIQRNIEQLKDEGILKDDGSPSEQGIELAALTLYTQEIDNIVPKQSLGDYKHKRIAHYGDISATKPYAKGDRYKDINVHKTIRTAIRRQHTEIHKTDLQTNQRESKGNIQLIYAMDTSASMKGEKIETCKKAGVALAYKALDNKDTVGIISFGSEIKTQIRPTNDFSQLLRAITVVTTGTQTDFGKALDASTQLFYGNQTKHLLILTDALPTVGEKPEKDTLKAVSHARSQGITISIVGIQLDKKGLALAQEIVRLGEGRLYVVNELKELGQIILQDYYTLL